MLLNIFDSLFYGLFQFLLWRETSAAAERAASCLSTARRRRRTPRFPRKIRSAAAGCRALHARAQQLRQSSRAPDAAAAAAARLLKLGALIITQRRVIAGNRRLREALAREGSRRAIAISDRALHPSPSGPRRDNLPLLLPRPRVSQPPPLVLRALPPALTLPPNSCMR